MAGEAHCAVVVALSEVAFVGKSNFFIMRDCVNDRNHFPVFHTALQLMVSTLIMSSS